MIGPDYDNWLYSGPNGPHDDTEYDDDGNPIREEREPPEPDNDE